MDVFEAPYLDEDGNFQTIKIYSQYDSDKYFAQEKLRWRQGYGNLTGRHYFHLTWGNIVLENGTRIKPQWCDGDAVLFDGFDFCSKEVWDMVVFKRMRAHFTTFCASLLVYNCVVYPLSTSLFTSADTDRIDDMRIKKLAPVIESCISLLMDNPDDVPVMNASFTHFVKKGGIEKLGSQIVYPETSKDPKSPNKIQGYTLILGIADEMLIHPRIKAVRKVMGPRLNQGLNRIKLLGEDGKPDGHHAVFLQGGSCDNVDMMGVQRAKQIITAANNGARIKIYEIPGWMSLPDFMDESGFSKKDEAIKFIYKHRQKLADAQEWDELANYTMNYYVTLDEIVSNASKNVLGEVVMHKLKESLLALMNHDDVTQCDFARNGNDVVTVLSKDKLGAPKGNIFYRKLREPTHTYGIGLDPIPFNTSNPEGSHMVAVVKDFTADEDVAYMDIRTTDVEYAMNMLETLSYAYRSDMCPKGAWIMFERNRFETGMQWCQSHGKVYLLAPDPKRPEKAKSGLAVDRGSYKTENTTLNNLLYNSIRKKGLQFMKMHEDFDKFGGVSEEGNPKSDILDAKSEVELLHDFINTRLRPREINKNRMPNRTLGTNEMGETVYKYADTDDDN